MAIGSDAVMTVAFFGAVASVAWSAAFAWAKWLARPREPVVLSGDAERRLARLEQAVDVVAVELERIAEAHRFTARLLEERLPPAPRPALPRAERANLVTPH
jgi:hypothetical protein